MREYMWNKGHWVTDGHLWAMLLDIPKLPREDTGERVLLRPPQWIFYGHPKPVEQVECKIFFVPKANIYIAIGEKACYEWDVLFFDKISYLEECNRRFPGREWVADPEW